MAIKNNSVTFRHPLLLDKKGKPGRLICRGIAGFENEQGKIGDTMNWLLANRPRIRSSIPEEHLSNLHEEALKIWFEALTKSQADDNARKAQISKHKRELRMSRIEERLAKQAGMAVPEDLDAFTIKQSQYVTLLLNRIIDLEFKLNRALIDGNAKDKELKGVLKATGRSLALSDAITLEQCLDHFKKVWKSPSQDAYDKTIQRAGYIVNELGKNTKHSTVTKGVIESALLKSKHSDPMKLKLFSLAKTFFKTLAYVPESDGLGLRDPAASIEVPAKAKRKPELIDPRQLMELPMLEYWRNLAAVLGFGGLRLAEAAALVWEHVDFHNEILKVLPTDIYPNLKSALSERPVKPFPNVWPILKEWKKTNLHEKLVFPRIGGKPKTGITWFRDYKGKPNASDLSGDFKAAIFEALPEGLLNALEAVNDLAIHDIVDHNLNESPALKLRHWWETTMRANGYAVYIEDMGGHEDETGRTHYTEVLTVVMGAKIKEL